MTLELFVKDFNETLAIETDYGSSFLKTYNRKKIYNYLARMWVVCRYEDGGENERIKQEHTRMVNEGIRGVFFLDDESVITQQENILQSYCNIVSLLFKDSKDYFGANFLLGKVIEDIHYTSFSGHLNTRIMMWGMGCSKIKLSGKRKESWDDWFYTKKYEDRLLRITHLIDQSLSSENSDTLVYIGNVLENASSIADSKYKLVILVGILELLLTHNPDPKFNVEDSIRKQFVLKTSALVYLFDKKTDLNAVKGRLKVIYDQRSNIAHGNFDKYTEYIKKLSKKEGEEEYFDDLIVDTYYYIKAVLTIYFRDDKFVRHMKNG